MIAPHTSCRYAVIRAWSEGEPLGLQVAAVHGLTTEGLICSPMRPGPGESHYALPAMAVHHMHVRGLAPNLGAALTLLRWMEDRA